jgi:hypothetical protein
MTLLTLLMTELFVVSSCNYFNDSTDSTYLVIIYIKGYIDIHTHAHIYNGVEKSRVIESF